MTRILLLLTLALVNIQAYFTDLQHRSKTKTLLTDFVTQFTNRYNAISIGGLDFMEAMELGLGYWITRIRIHSFETISVFYQLLSQDGSRYRK